jgi:hypothetical protein
VITCFLAVAAFMVVLPREAPLRRALPVAGGAIYVVIALLAVAGMRSETAERAAAAP